MAREDRSQLLAYCRIVIAGLHQRFGRVAQTETGEQRAPECRFDRADGDPSTIRATIRRVVVRAAVKKIAGTRRPPAAIPAQAIDPPHQDPKSVVSGKSVTVRVDIGGARN